MPLFTQYIVPPTPKKYIKKSPKTPVQKRWFYIIRKRIKALATITLSCYQSHTTEFLTDQFMNSYNRKLNNGSSVSFIVKDTEVPGQPFLIVVKKEKDGCFIRPAEVFRSILSCLLLFDRIPSSHNINSVDKNQSDDRRSYKTMNHL